MAWDYILKSIKVAAARACLKAFTAMYARPWTGVQFVVSQEVQRQSVDMLRQWLRFHRFQHCERCLGLKGPLKLAHIEIEARQVYLCERCMKQGIEAGVAKPALELVKP